MLRCICRLHEKADQIIASRTLVDAKCINLEEVNDILPADYSLNDEERELYPIETQVLLSRFEPVWLLNISPEEFSMEVTRFQFLCECLTSNTERKRAKTASEYYKEHYQKKEDTTRAASYEEAINYLSNAGSPVSFLPLKEYFSRDCQCEGHKLPAAYTQQLLALPKPKVVADRPKSASHVTEESSHVDSRFRGKLWSKERVLLWCSNFQDTASHHVVVSKMQARARPHSANATQARNSSSATESRLRMLTLSTTAKSVGKLRVNAITPPALTPPTITRTDFRAAQSLIKNLDVKLFLKKKKEQSESLANRLDNILAEKKHLVKQTQEKKNASNTIYQENKRLNSAKANSRVKKALEEAMAASAAHNEKSDSLRVQLARQVQNDKRNSKISHQCRKEMRNVSATLNTIAAATSRRVKKKDKISLNAKKGSKGESKIVSTNAPAGAKSPLVLGHEHYDIISDSLCVSNQRDEETEMLWHRQIEDTTYDVYAKVVDLEESRKREHHNKSMNELLLTKASNSRKIQSKIEKGKFDDSLSLCSYIDKASRIDISNENDASKLSSKNVVSTSHETLGINYLTNSGSIKSHVKTTPLVESRYYIESAINGSEAILGIVAAPPHASKKTHC